LAISTDYPRPVLVNGYTCRNCDDVASAKKNVDPAAPKPGTVEAARKDSAVSFGGNLQSLNDKAYDDTSPNACAAQPGAKVNVCC
jgi:hypothetical protein